MCGALLIVFITKNCYAQTWQPVEITYYMETPKDSGEYLEYLSWQITNPNEYAIFNNAAIGATRIEPFSDPREPGGGGFFHIHRESIDKISGDDFFITKNGILKKSKTAIDTMYSTSPKFYRFLQGQVTSSSSFGIGSKNKEIDIDTPGIVVVVNASQSLGNPSWIISDPKNLETYLAYIEKLKPETSKVDEDRMVKFDKYGSYFLYLNYPGAPGKLLSITDSANARVTNTELRTSYFLDEKDYFSHFKYIARKIIEQREGIKDSQEELMKQREF